MRGFIVCVSGNYPSLYAFFRNKDEKNLAIMRIHQELEERGEAYGYLSYGVFYAKDLKELEKFPTEPVDFDEVIEGYEASEMIAKARETARVSREKKKAEEQRKIADEAALEFRKNFQ